MDVELSEGWGQVYVGRGGVGFKGHEVKWIGTIFIQSCRFCVIYHDVNNMSITQIPLLMNLLKNHTIPLNPWKLKCVGQFSIVFIIIYCLIMFTWHLQSSHPPHITSCVNHTKI